MSEKAAKTARQNQRNALPVCPHCGADPARFSLREVRIGNYQAAMLFCADLDCRKVYSVDVLGVVQPQQQPRIARPM